MATTARNRRSTHTNRTTTPRPRRTTRHNRLRTQEEQIVQDSQSHLPADVCRCRSGNKHSHAATTRQARQPGAEPEQTKARQYLAITHYEHRAHARPSVETSSRRPRAARRTAATSTESAERLHNDNVRQSHRPQHPSTGPASAQPPAPRRGPVRSEKQQLQAHINTERRQRCSTTARTGSQACLERQPRAPLIGRPQQKRTTQAPNRQPDHPRP